MDADFWASKVHQTRHFTSTMQTTRHNSADHHLGFDDSEGEDDLRSCFPCPFCYVDIEMHSLCTHLQEEHCFDFKNAVCPVCAGNLGKDIIGHFTLQHSSSLKRRRKSQRSGLWNNSPSMLSKELREPTSFGGVNSAKGGSRGIDSAPDPLLSPFLCSVAPPESNSNSVQSSEIDSLSICGAKRKKAWIFHWEKELEIERTWSGFDVISSYLNSITCLATTRAAICAGLFLQIKVKTRMNLRSFRGQNSSGS